MTNKEYIGITIGPIYDTLELTSTPAGLWAASYMFSYIARELCQRLVLSGVSTSDFVSPYIEVDRDNKIIIMPESIGIGLYHDRIIFRSKMIGMNEVKSCVEQVVQQVTDELISLKMKCPEELFKYLNKYFQIYSLVTVLEEQDNPILKISPMLDSLENFKAFVMKENFNPLLSFFENTEGEEQEGQNRIIKNSFLVKDAGGKKWPLFDQEGNIKDLKNIASEGEKITMFKRQQYYAVVQADGDNMGAILKTKQTNEINQFSKDCFSYAINASQLISKYGGIVIFAGGDDLLFLAPVNNKDNITIFDLLKNIEESFKGKFPKNSVSFGVSIQYYKYPLYEALKSARNLLFINAKDKKNSTAVSFLKHSGQTFGFVTSGSDRYFFKDILKGFSDNDNKFLRSIAYKLQEFKVLFHHAITNSDGAQIENLFNNLFNNLIHQTETNDAYIQEVKDQLIQACNTTTMMPLNKKTRALKDDGLMVLDVIDTILRIQRFYSEKGSVAGKGADKGD